jgi:hypothetical protein
METDNETKRNETGSAHIARTGEFERVQVAKGWSLDERGAWTGLPALRVDELSRRVWGGRDDFLPLASGGRPIFKVRVREVRHG